MKNKIRSIDSILFGNRKWAILNSNVTKKLLVAVFLFLSFNISAQTIEVKFLDKEQYVYYLKKHPQTEQGFFIDEKGTKYLVLSETNSLFDLLKKSQLDGLINAKEVNKEIVYVTTTDITNFKHKTPYVIDYDNKGNYSIKD